MPGAGITNLGVCSKSDGGTDKMLKFSNWKGLWGSAPNIKGRMHGANEPIIEAFSRRWQRLIDVPEIPMPFVRKVEHLT